MSALLEPTLWALGMSLVGTLVFAAIGMVSGTDETATIAPLTLLVVLLGVPPAGVLAFFMSSIAAKHITHAIPTTLLGIPGDTLAAPLLRDAQMLRELGVPHIALRKAISGGVISAVVAVPLAVLFALVITPLSDPISKIAPWLFLAAAVLIAVTSKGRWGALIVLIPFSLVVVGLNSFATGVLGKGLSISFFLGIATGPLIADLVLAATPAGRASLHRDSPRTFELASDVHTWKGRMPNPLRVLDRGQIGNTLSAAAVSSATFVFSPVAMTVLMGEVFGGRIKNGYRRLTTMMAVKNGTTESTYIAETLIPLIAIGLPLSPMAAGPANPLFNAPPVYTIDAATNTTNNLHNLLAPWQFAVIGFVAVLIAIVITYPFVIKYAHQAASWIMRHVSHEAIIGAFAGLIAVICLYEGGVVAILVAVTIGLVGGLLNKLFNMHTGVQFMGYYVAVLTVPAITNLFAG